MQAAAQMAQGGGMTMQQPAAPAAQPVQQQPAMQQTAQPRAAAKQQPAAPQPQGGQPGDEARQNLRASLSNMMEQFRTQTKSGQ